MISFVGYLNDEYKAGSTAFLKSGKKVAACAGDAIFFRNIRPDRTVDPFSRHASLPIVSGEKWVWVQWFPSAAKRVRRSQRARA